MTHGEFPGETGRRSDDRELDEDRLDKGVRAAFSESESVFVPSTPYRTVLDKIDDGTGETFRINLHDIDDDPSPVNYPGVVSQEIPAQIGRYRIVGEIARGGVGSIYKARDEDLGRDIALKVLLGGFRENPEMTRRFMEEAQVGGQLQHPGIVPVHEVGLFSGRNVYFAMKLVKGQTLARILEQRGDPADERPRLLGIFEQICQPLAYAHARGVIHRDLKPSNVMVGAFGEVQMMDWGLAKVLSRGGIADDRHSVKRPAHESVVRTVRTGSTGSESLFGSVLGTPAYMAPEQARGEVDELDERSDVFGLGAILCEILTGKPPYEADTSEGMLRQAKRGALDHARSRLDACAADREVIELAKRCLASEPKDRPRDAGAVAADVRDYLESLEDRARSVEIRAARFRVKMTVALAAALLLAVGIGVASWWVDEGERRQARATATVKNMLADARSLRATAEASDSADHAAWSRALKAIESAERQVTADVDDETRKSLARERSDIENGVQKSLIRSRLEDLRDIPLERDSTSLDELDSRYASAFRTFLGADVEAMDLAEADDLIRASGMKEELAFALREWTFVRYLLSLRKGGDWGERAEEVMASKISRLASRVSPSELWTRHRQLGMSRSAIDVESPFFTDFVRDAPTAQLVILAKGIGMSERSLNLHAAATALRVALRREPGNSRVLYELSRVLRLSGRPAEALPYALAAKSMRPEKARPWWALGEVLETMRDYDGALEAYVQAALLDPGDEYFRREVRRLLERRDRPEFGDVALERVLASLSNSFDGEDPVRRVAGEMIDVLAYASIDSALVNSGIVIEEGDSWRYFAASVRPSPGVEWAAPDFDDNAWPAGPSGFGYGDEDDATVLSEMRGRHRRVFIRRAFDVPDPARIRRLELSIRVDDGCVVYVNGEPLARSRVTPEGDAWGTFEPLIETAFEIPRERLNAGRNVVAIEGVNSSRTSGDFSLIPELRGELVPDAALDASRSRIEQLQTLFSKYSSPAIRAYFEGRVLQCSGEHGKARDKLRLAFRAHPESGSARSAYLSCLLMSRSPADGEADLREVFSRSNPEPVSFWDSYLRQALTEQRWTAAEALAPFRRDDGSLVGDTFYCHATRIFLERLREGRVVRINCGGWNFRGASGEAWGRDRFFAGGAAYAFGTSSYRGEIHETDDDTIYQWERWFWASGSSAAYRVPLPRGGYRVTLHFAEIHSGQHERFFDVLLEGEKVLDFYGAGAQVGSATADVRSFDVRVEDGQLDIELLPRVEHQQISGIEIQPSD